MKKHKGPWIQTYTRKRFYPWDPRAADIDIRDIAHALAYTCRYNGHSGRFYSVAEHSVYVSRLCAAPYDRKTRLWGLLHDAAEAYVGDMVRPIKTQITAFQEIEYGVQSVICERFGLDDDQPESVHAADMACLLAEVEQLNGGQVAPYGIDGEPAKITIEGLHPQDAEKAFLAEFALLTGTGPVVIDTAAGTLKPADASNAGEVRVVDPTTGGEKGQKLARFSLLPWAELWEVAEHYGRGAAKYADRNWERGYAYNLSFDALMRHLAAWWGGESRDPETGTSHLAAVVFHALALRYFEKHHPDHDNRPRAPRPLHKVMMEWSDEVGGLPVQYVDRCPHGEPAGDCSACDHAGDIAYDSMREGRK